MKILVLICSLICVNAFALEYGECLTDWRSKQYIQADFSAPYPRTIKFTCEYRCSGDSGYEVIRGTHTVTVHNMSEDATQVVCQGVKVSRRTWGYDYDRTVSFYSYLGNSQEIKSWAFKNVSKDNPMEEALLLELKEKLLQVGSSYLIAGRSEEQFSYFKDAALVLNEIAAALPGDTSKLDSALSFYKDPLSYEATSKERLISAVLRSQASFRIK